VSAEPAVLRKERRFHLHAHLVEQRCQAWDALLAALPDRPMLVEETGMMRYNAWTHAVAQ